MRSARARLVAPIVVSLAALAALAGSCTEISANPSLVTSLEFDSLPYPAVVTGDTLRDSLGNATPLRAIAFNASGNVLPNATIQFFALDSGITISPTGIVTAQLRNGMARIIASVPALQSEPETLIVTRRPDTVIVTPLANDTLYYVLPDNPGTNVVPALALQVATYDTIGGITGTQGWLVTYQLLFHGQVVAPTDTTVASIWSASGVATLVDTTAVGGLASVELRVRPAGLPTTAESLTVIANVKYRGAPVRGSPVVYLIQVRPQVVATPSSQQQPSRPPSPRPGQLHDATSYRKVALPRRPAQ
jgi:hypothetical protein